MYVPLYLLLIFILTSPLLGTPPDPTQTREWRDHTGQFRVEAAFLSYKNGMLQLHKVNGVIIEVPEKMSTEDRPPLGTTDRAESPEAPRTTARAARGKTKRAAETEDEGTGTLRTARAAPRGRSGEKENTPERIHVKEEEVEKLPPPQVAGKGSRARKGATVCRSCSLQGDMCIMSPVFLYYTVIIIHRTINMVNITVYTPSARVSLAVFWIAVRCRARPWNSSLRSMRDSSLCRLMPLFFSILGVSLFSFSTASFA
jgi:hypothetical protein